METIQLVLDKPLLVAANRLAKKTGMNRSALIREALREFVKRRRYEELVEKDRRGYQARRDSDTETLLWEREAAWEE